jgi:DNA-binding MarR family transcriptional regulator
MPKTPGDTQERFLREFGSAGQALSSATVAYHQAVADRLGLHITDHKALGILLEEGPLPAGALAEALSLSTGSVTALVDRLEGAGYVRRGKDPADRRRVVVAPVRDPELLGKVFALFEPMTRRLAEEMPEFDAKERALILDFLRRATRALNQAVGEVRRGDG